MRITQVWIFSILIEASFIILLSCTSASKERPLLTNCDSLLLDKKITQLEMPLYTVNDRFYPMLDSIIIVEGRCKTYRECATGFLFVTDATDSSKLIEVSSTNILRYDHTKSYGLFHYKGFKFLCLGTYDEGLLAKTNTTTPVTFLDFDKANDWFRYSDEYSSWYLLVTNDSIVVNGHHLCEE